MHAWGMGAGGDNEQRGRNCACWLWWAEKKQIEWTHSPQEVASALTACPESGTWGQDRHHICKESLFCHLFTISFYPSSQTHKCLCWGSWKCCYVHTAKHLEGGVLAPASQQLLSSCKGRSSHLPLSPAGAPFLVQTTLCGLSRLELSWEICCLRDIWNNTDSSIMLVLLAAQGNGSSFCFSLRHSIIQSVNAELLFTLSQCLCCYSNDVVQKWEAFALSNHNLCCPGEQDSPEFSGHIGNLLVLCHCWDCILVMCVVWVFKGCNPTLLPMKWNLSSTVWKWIKWTPHFDTLSTWWI